MQSYEHHIVEEALSKRHPYIQESFQPLEIDPSQITIAVFDRMIPKFRDVLSNSDEMDPEIIANCLKTLNEQVHHQVSSNHYLTIVQETADMMLDADILQLTAQLLKYEDTQVREQASLLLGSFALSFNGRALFEFAF